MEKCKICKSETNIIFSEKVLNKHVSNYLKCSNCGFIQLNDTFWLEEAYESPITNIDIGLLSRNYSLTNTTSALIDFFFDKKKAFLDYAGGYGVFVRLMRDKGYNFLRTDPYCENIFAKEFEFQENSINTNFELLTAFEVFEHLEYPIEEIEKILKLGKSILFSTYLIPNKKITSAKDWWYIMPETGQHIAFYSLESLTFIAKKYNLNLYTNKRNLHLLTPKKINKWIFKILTIDRLSNIYNILKSKKSLTDSDYKALKELYFNSNN